MRKKRWDDLSGRQKVLAATFMTVQFSLALAAWTDLARRPAIQIKGRKSVWVPVIGGVYYIGPLLYFRFGRRGPAHGDASTPDDPGPPAVERPGWERSGREPGEIGLNLGRRIAAFSVAATTSRLSTRSS